MKNPKMTLILKDAADKYPAELERQFPRIFDRVVELWGKPEATRYLQELLIDTAAPAKDFPLK